MSFRPSFPPPPPALGATSDALDFVKVKRTPESMYLTIKFPEIYRAKVLGGWLMLCLFQVQHSDNFRP